MTNARSGTSSEASNASATVQLPYSQISRDPSSDVIAACAALAAESLSTATAIATYTSSGSTALGVARVRPTVPILGLSPIP
ncbi:MAG: hypothetical protein KDJ45_13055 [Hyphomicrobiaceae bacterium]|nr:hypothetical protein [Hyphomicrobiaceae bacterium]